MQDDRIKGIDKFLYSDTVACKHFPKHILPGFRIFYGNVFCELFPGNDRGWAKVQFFPYTFREKEDIVADIPFIGEIRGRQLNDARFCCESFHGKIAEEE